jgi:hypothetical protein
MVEFLVVFFNKDACDIADYKFPAHNWDAAYQYAWMLYKRDGHRVGDVERMTIIND